MKKLVSILSFTVALAAFAAMSVCDLAIFSTCTKLTNVDLSGAKSPVDVSFAAKCPKLKRLNLQGCAFENGAARKDLPKLKVSTDGKTTGL